MPRPYLVEPASQRLYACHPDRSLGSRLAFESGAEVLAALVGHPLHLSCRSPLGDSCSPIPGRCVWQHYHCASACVSSQVCLAVCFLVSGDAGVPRDPVDLGCNAVPEEALRPLLDPPRQSLPWAWLKVYHSSDCGLRVAEACHRLHSLHLKYFSVLNRHSKRESDCPQLGFEDLHASGAQKSVARPPFMSVCTHCCGSHPAII